MPSICVVEGCSNPGSVRFPKEKGVLLSWRVAINRQGDKKGSLWTPSPYSRLCHSHFAPEDYRIPQIPIIGSERKVLKKDAVPSLSLSKSGQKRKKDTDVRLKRRQRREIVASTSAVVQALDTSVQVMDDQVQGTGDPVQVADDPVQAPEMDWIASEETIRVEAEKEKQTSFEQDCLNSEKGVQVSMEMRSVGTSTNGIKMPYQSQMSIESFKDKPDAILFYTGFKNYEHFGFFYHCLEPAIHRLNYKCPKLSEKNELFLTLIKLRCAKVDVELSIMFGITQRVVSSVFSTILRFLYYHLQDLTPWLPKNIIKDYMPLDFKAKYPETRVILDATEVKIQKPGNIKEQAATWSCYKNDNTVKTMVGIAPKGVVTFVSDTVGGHTSDRQIIERSNLISDGKFETGDEIMADRGIMVQDIFASKNVRVNTPTMLKGKSQLSSMDVIRDCRVAAKRIHVERVIGLAKTFKILTHDIHHSQRALADKIIFVCFALCNFKPCIVGEYA